MEYQMRRLLASVAASVGFAMSSGSAVADASTYPSRPVRVLVGFAPGGAVDIAGRTMAQQLQKALGQPFVVENKPGVGGLIALKEGARAEPDGHTLLVGSAGPLTVSPSLFKKQQFDPQASLEPIIYFVNTPGIIVVRKDLKVDSVKELIELSKREKLTMASAGAGSILHLMGEHFQESVGIEWTHVPYKGSSPALVDLTGGRVDVMIDVVPTAAQFVKSGQLRALAVTTKNRSSRLPDVPTLGEMGYDFDMGSWMALLAPKGTSPDIVAKLNDALNRSVKDPEVIERVSAMGGELVGGTPEDLVRKLDVEIPRWRAIIEKNNLGAD
jgi:tripartite-type tricarboxylate transporter receptor subunit TctC